MRGLNMDQIAAAVVLASIAIAYLPERIRDVVRKRK